MFVRSVFMDLPFPESGGWLAPTSEGNLEQPR